MGLSNLWRALVTVIIIVLLIVVGQATHLYFVDGGIRGSWLSIVIIGGVSVAIQYICVFAIFKLWKKS